uniref:Ig-like domain-containing protein n=1 Tax=Macrostomum lignano TaxID=282301 RepID=A0A1I8IQH6_9PLAT
NDLLNALSIKVQTVLLTEKGNVPIVVANGKEEQRPAGKKKPPPKGKPKEDESLAEALARLKGFGKDKNETKKPEPVKPPKSEPKKAEPKTPAKVTPVLAAPSDRPAIKQKPETVSTVEGRSIRVAVPISGAPFPEVKFYKGNKELKQDERTRVVSLPERQEAVLKIKPAEPTDEGKYSCVVQDTTGVVYDQAKFNVLVKEQGSAPDEESDEEIPELKIAPVSAAKDDKRHKMTDDINEIQSQLDARKASEKQDGSILGFGQLKATEKKKANFDLKSFESLAAAGGKCTLVAALVCCVFERVWCAPSSFRPRQLLGLAAQPVGRLSSDLPIGYASDSIAASSLSVIFAGERLLQRDARRPEDQGGHPMVKFRCVFSRPNAKFRWLKNKLEIFQGPKYNIRCNGDEYILEIKKVLMEDAGVYTCKMGDDLSTSANLEVSEQQKKFSFNQRLPDTTHVVRNKDINLECSINDPRAPVSWYKGGEKLEYFPNRYEMKRRENRCILRVVKARDEDERPSDQTYTDVVLEDPDWFFNRNLRPQECFEGDAELAFECEVNDKDAVVKWFFCSNPDVDPMDTSRLQKLEPGKDEKYKAESMQRTKRKLTIFNLDTDWDGVIICRTAKKATSARLTVKPDVEFKKSLYDTKGIETRKKELMVSLRNPKQHEVRWLKDNEPIETSSRVEIKENKDDSYLIFHSLELDDEGIYTVRVGKHSCKCELQVEECEKPPAVVGKTPESVKLKKGQPFSCSMPVKGFPVPSVALLRNGEPTPETVSLKAIPLPGQVQLVLDNADGAQRSDRGKYDLKLSNSAGDELVPINIDILDRPERPGDPLDVTDLAHDGCSLLWDAPEDDGGAPITGYEVEQMDSTDGVNEEAWKPVKTVPKEECRIGGLTEGNKYRFRVRAVNAEGKSDWLQTEKDTVARDPWDPPEPPGPCSLVDWDKNFAELEWSPPRSDNGSPVLKYIVQSRSKAAPTWTAAKEVGARDLKARVESLKEGQEYEFRVIAVNKAGNSEPGDPAGPVVAKPRFLKPQIDRQGLRPVQLKAGGPIRLEVKFLLASLRLRLSGLSETNRWTLHWLLLSPTSIGPDNCFFVFVCTRISVKEAARSHSGVYKVTVVNEVGEDSADVEVLVLGKPGRPEGPLEVSDVTKTSCQLTWKPPTDDGGSPVQNYVVQKLDTQKGEWETVSETVSGTTFTVPRLKEGHEYQFRVAAETLQGISEPLETSGAPTKAKNPYDAADAPAAPEIVDHDRTKVDLAFKPPRRDGGSPIIGYIVERKEIKATRWVKVTRNPVPGLEFTDDTVKEGKEYEYRVAAVNAAGPSEVSPSSKPVKAKPSKAAPELDLSALGLGPDGGEIRVRAGEPLQLEIPVDGAPKPTVAWTKDAAPVGPSAQVEDKEEATKLRVDNAKKSDAGLYEIVASNANGTAKAAVRVVVLDRPDPPEGPLDVSDILATSCQLAWRPPKDTGGCELTGYEVERCEEGDRVWEKVPPATALGDTETSRPAKQLRDGKRYRFRVRANRSASTGLIEIRLPLSWKPPKSDGGNPVVGYLVEKRQKGVDLWEKVGMGVPTTERLAHIINSGLVENREFEFRVSAVNAAGPGEPSKATQPVLIRDPVLPAGAPGEVTVEKVRRDGAQLSWSKPRSDGGSKITGFVVEKKGPSGDWVPVKTVPANERATFVPLNEGEEAQFRVRAENEAGPGEPTRPSRSVKAENEPEAPKLDMSGLKDVTIKAGQDLLVKLPYRGCPKPTVILERDGKDYEMTEDGGRMAITENETADRGELTLSASKATGANSGEYKITLKNLVGKDTGTMRITVLDKPGTCTGPLEATDIEANQVTLKWAPPKSDGGEPVSNYVLEKRPKGSEEWQPVNSFLAGTSATVKGLEEGKPYEFRVMAENSQGRSAPLNTSSPVTPKPPYNPPSACSQPNVDEVTADSVSLSWAPPKENGGSPVTGYLVEKKAKGDTAWSKASATPVQGTSYTVKNLPEGKEFEFRVTPVNKAGPGTASEPTARVRVQAPLTAPKVLAEFATKEVTANAGEEFKIRVPYQGSPPDSVECLRNGNEAVPVERFEVRQEASEVLVVCRKATKADEARYNVILSNKAGKDSVDVKVNVVDKPAPPEGPLEVTKVGADSCALAWRPPKDDGGAPIDNYVKQDPRTGEWSPVSKFVRKPEYEAMGLETDKPVRFRVRAENRNGLSEPLELETPVTPKPAYRAASAPESVSATDADADSVSLSWRKPRDDGGSKITGYVVECRPAGGSGKWKRVAEVPGRETTAKATGLETNAKYEFRVTAKNEAGLGEPSEASHAVETKSKTTAPSAPGSPMVNKTGKNYAELAWTKPINDGGSRLTGYRVEKRKKGAGDGDWETAAT